jgi:hypothetical protein
MKFLQIQNGFCNSSLHAEPMYEQTLKPVAHLVGVKSEMGGKINIGNELVTGVFLRW